MLVALVLAAISAMALPMVGIRANASDDGVGIGETLDTDAAYISRLEVTDKSTGSEPFDSDDEPGNDSTADNDIVRSFDDVSYEIEYVVTPYDDAPFQYYRYSRVGFRFIVDYADENVASFDTDSMGWMDATSGYEHEVTTETIDGVECQVLTCYRQLVPTDDVPTTVPSTNTVNLMLKVGAAANGDKIHVSVESWCEHNDIDGECERHGRDEMTRLDVPELTVSAAPRYNVDLKQGSTSWLVGKGDYDFSTGNELAPNKDAGIVNGRMYSFGVTLQLYNTSAAKRLKGIEIPTGEIDLKIDMTSTFIKDGTEKHDVTDTYTPLVWSLGGNSGGDSATGECERAVLINGQPDHAYAVFAGPYNMRNGSMSAGYIAGVNNGGKWIGEQDGNTITVDVNGYEIDVDYFPDTTAGHSSVDNDHRYYNGTQVANIGCFSCSELWVIQPYKNLNTGESCLEEFDCSNGDFTMTLTDYALQATSISGQSLEEVDDASNQSVISDDKVAQTMNVRRPGTYDSSIIYTHKDGGTGYVGTDKKTYKDNAVDGTDSALPGSVLRIASFADSYPKELDDRQAFSSMLIKFDDKAIEYDPSRGLTGTYLSSTTTQMLFMTKPDGNGWVDDEEQKNTTIDELIQHDTYQEIIDDGAICVAVLLNSKGAIEYNGKIPRTTFVTGIPIILRNDVPIGYVAMTTNQVKTWTYADIAADMGVDGSKLTTQEVQNYIDTNVPDDITEYDVEPTYQTNYGPKYTKSVYDETGYVGGHVGSSHYGDSLLAIGEKVSIDKTTAQQSNSKPKQVYDIDYAQRYVDYVLSPAFDTSDAPSVDTDRTTDITIVDTLPSDLTYVPNTSYIGGTYAESNGGQSPGTVTGGTRLEPSATKNDDGTTTLVWTIPDVEYGSAIDRLYFSCQIGTLGDEQSDVENNQQIVNDVEIGSTYDNRDKREDYGNKTSCTIKISKLRAQSLAIRPRPMLNDVSSEIAFTSTLGNYSAMSKVGFGVNIMPYVGTDSQSSFSGTYAMPTMTVTDNGGDMSQLTFYATTDPSVRSEELIGMTADGITSSPFWVKCSFDPSTGIVTLPNGGSGITAWCVIDAKLSPDELISIDMPLQPTGNRAGDTYASRWSDGDNVVNATIYVVERTISGRVFVDVNGNDAYDDGEQLVSDVIVKVVDGDGNVVRNLEGDACEIRTGADGSYSFTALPAGDISVSFEPSASGGWRYMSAATPNADGVDDAIDSDAEPQLDGDGALASAMIAGIEMPAVSKMASTVYASEHNDLGIMSNGHAEIAVKKTAAIEHQPHCGAVGGEGADGDDDGNGTGDDAAHVGDTIRYSIVVTNVGDVDVSDASIDDGLLGIDGLVIADVIPVGESVEYVDGFHVVTIDDVRNGIVTNEVTAHAEPPAHVERPADVSDDVDTPTTATPAIEIRKLTDVTLIEDAKPGDEIPYSFIVENTGDVPLTDIKATDVLDAIGNVTLDRTELLPGEIATGTATYAITQNDIDAGHVVNTATVVGTGIDDRDATDASDKVETMLKQSPSLSLVKDVDRELIDPASVGDELTYAFTVTNTGNVTLMDIRIDDELNGLGDIVFDWTTSTDADTVDGVLAVGESVKARAMYGVTQDDIDAGEAVNVATAHATTIGGDDVSSNEDDAVTVLRAPEPEPSVDTPAGDDNVDDVKDISEVEDDAIDDGNIDVINQSDDGDKDAGQSDGIAGDIVSTGVDVKMVAAVIGVMSAIAVLVFAGIVSKKR